MCGHGNGKDVIHPVNILDVDVSKSWKPTQQAFILEPNIRHGDSQPISGQAQQMDVRRLCSNTGGGDGVDSGKFGEWT